MWVIDSKRQVAKHPEKRVEGGLFRPPLDSIIIRGRDQPSLVDGVLKQVEQVRAVVGDVPVIGARCFVDAAWPPFAEPSTIKGVQVLSPKKLAERVKRSVDPAIDVPTVTEAVDKRFVRP